MKHAIFAVVLMAPIAAHAGTGTEAPSLGAQLRCTWLTLQQAARGDFSQWVLPEFVPGRHLRAGEYPDCLPVDGQSGSEPPPSPGQEAR